MNRAPRLALAAACALLLGAGPQLPAPVVRTLPNGLKVVVLVRPGLPIVQTQLQVDAGLAAEPAGHSGLALLTAQLLRRGTTSRSAEDFSTELDTLGATFAVNVTREAAQVAAGSRVSEFESVLELMSDAVVNPLFGDEDFQTARRQIAAQLGQQAQNLGAVADDRAAQLAFGPHPYGRPVLGDITSLLGATRDQARDFHRARWRPDHAVLAIAGDVDPERAFAAANEWFGRWSGKSEPLPAPAAPRPRAGVWLFDLPGAPACEVRAAVATPGRGDAAYPAWLVARELLSASLPAGIRVTLSPGRDAGMLMLAATSRVDSAAAVAARMRSALTALATAPPAGAALESARRRAAQSWALSLETLGQWLTGWLAGDAAGLPPGHLATMAESERRADLTPVSAVLRAGFPLLLVGPADRVKTRLASLGPVQMLAQQPEPSLADTSLRVTAEQRRRGKQLIGAAVLAHGGAAKLGAVKSSVQQAELRMSAGGRDFDGEARFLRQDPDRIVYTTRFLEFEHRQVLDGHRGWALSMVGDSAEIVPADSSMMLSLRNLLESDLVHLLRAASDPASDAIALGKVTLDAKPADLVEFVTPLGVRTRLMLDPLTHRIRAVDALPTPQGPWRDRRRWSDYGQVQGIWWPRLEVREIDGEKVSTMVVRQIEVNAPVDSSLFRKPLVVRGQIRAVE